jgi:hypothetical protein
MILADAFKLASIATTIYPKPQLILCLSDPLAADYSRRCCAQSRVSQKPARPAGRGFLPLLRW